MSIDEPVRGGEGGATAVSGRVDGAVAALPWRWFEFLDGARCVGPGIEETVEQGGGERDWKVEVDGWEMPFKVLRGKAREAIGDEAGGVLRRPWLMLMHGMGLGIATFRAIAPYLMQTHDLILPDYAGFCAAGNGHAGRLGSAGFQVYARGMWRIAQAVGVERLSLGGNSLGGGLCLIAALMHPDRVEKMVLSNPACYPQRLPRTYRLARVPLLGELMMSMTAPEKLIAGVEYIGYVEKGKFEDSLRERYVRGLGPWENRMRLMAIMRCLPADARDFTHARHLGRLGELTMPVLISWGGRDPLLVEGSGERLAADLPRATFERHGDLAHMPHEEAAERIGRRWVAFLSARGPG